MKQLRKDQRVFIKVLTEMLKTFIDKNEDYGDSYKLDGVVGITIRLGDKLRRLKTISKNGYQIKVKGEKLRDTLKDIANYSVMAQVLMQTMHGKKKVINSNNKQKLVQQGKNRYPELTRPY